MNFNNAFNNNRKRLSLIMDANKISKIYKVNHYSPIFRYQNNKFNRKGKSKEYRKINSFENRHNNNNDISNSHSSNNNNLNFDLDIPETDTLVENQLKGYENYDCESICTDFESNKINMKGNNNNCSYLINNNLNNKPKNHNINEINNTNNISNTNEIKVENNENDFKLIINNQRKTIINLAQKYKKIEYAFFSSKKENNEKETSLDKCNIAKIKEYENLFQNYEEKINLITKEFEDYKIKALQDFAYKEKKLLELINKISDLEDENFRIIHSYKDVDKKKFILMEMKSKHLTLELHKVS